MDEPPLAFWYAKKLGGKVYEKKSRNHANSVDNYNNSDVNFSRSGSNSSNPK